MAVLTNLTQPKVNNDQKRKLGSCDELENRLDKKENNYCGKYLNHLYCSFPDFQIGVSLECYSWRIQEFIQPQVQVIHKSFMLDILFFYYYFPNFTPCFWRIHFLIIDQQNQFGLNIFEALLQLFSQSY